MTPEEFDTKLTAYALNDPGLTDAERTEIEARLRTDAAARQTLEETRQLGHLLTTGLAAEAQPAEPSVAPAVASSLARKTTVRRWVITTASLAAAVMVAVYGGLNYFTAADRSYAPVTANASAKMAVRESDERVNLAKLDKGLKNLAESEAPRVRPGVAREYVLPNDTAIGSDSAAGMPAAGGSPGGGGVPPAGPTFAGVAPPGSGAPGEAKGEPKPQPIDRSKGGFKMGVDGAEADHLRKHRPAKNPKDAPVDKLDDLRGNDLARVPSGGDQYRQLVENPFTRVEGQAALSTFGVDVDTASYAIVRNYLSRNTLPPPDAVRLEEMINYFPYRDAPPDGNDPFTVRVEMADCPWASKHKLARVALKAKPIDNSKRPPSNLVFLIDVSGSMNEPNKLPLVKAALKLLVGQLTENDRVAMVVYAGASGLVLDSTNASKKDDILAALDNLSAGGSTNGGSGIQLAYDVAVKHFIDKGTNRVILCTDGDWNVGTTGTDALVKLIEEKRKTGVFLSVFGFGMGNLRDEMMVQLAGKGNGNYGYIDTLAEAKKALVEQISGTLVTVAKDVKVQIEFNPAKVAAYRLIGYEKRKLAAEDFHNDKKDAGEMGAGHVVTALYELVPAGTAVGGENPVDGLRYQPAEKPKAAAGDKTTAEAFVVKLRHKLPDAEKSTLREIPVGDVTKSYDKASEDFQFSSAVAAFGMLLKQSPYRGNASYALVEELAASAMTHDPSGYRAEFVQLVKTAKALSKQP